MNTISVIPWAASYATPIVAILMIPALTLAQRNAPAQNIVVDTTSSHAVSSFSPLRSLGA